MKKLLLLIVFFVSGISVFAQYSDPLPFTQKHYPTKDFILNDKIPMMHNANNALDLIDEYKRNIWIGAGGALVGVGTIVYAGSFMDVPHWFNGPGDYSHLNHRARVNRNERYLVTAVGVLITAGSVYFIYKNAKLLGRAEILIQPFGVGIRFNISN